MASIELENLVICENAILAQEGKVSLINIFSNINSSSFPAIHPKLVIFTVISGDSGRHTEKIEIVSTSDNQTIAFVESQVDIGDDGRNNFVANFINTVFPQEGDFWVKVSVDGDVLSSQENQGHLISTKKA